MSDFDYFSAATGTNGFGNQQGNKIPASQPYDYFSAASGTDQIAGPKEKTKALLPDLPSIYSQFPNELEGPMGMAATFGASDPAMGDVVAKQLGDRFIRRETVSTEGDPKQPFRPRGSPTPSVPSETYDVIVSRGPNGEEQRGYVNKPGLDSEDVVRGVRGALPYVGTGLGGMVAGAGRGLLANMAIQGALGGATSVGGDAALIPMGSEQGIDVPKALISTALGAAAPGTGRAAGNTAQYISDTVRPLPAELNGVSRGAVRRVARAVRDDRLTPQDFAAQSAELGPEGALMDMGDNLRGQAGGIARMPGEGQTILRDAARDRAAGSAGRQTTAIDNALGPAQNMVELERNTVDAANQAAAPHYAQFQAADIPMTQELAAALREAQHWGAVPEAVRMARGQSLMPRAIDRLEPDVMTPITGLQRRVTDLVPSGQELDYVKRALDARAKKAFDNGDTHLGTLINNTAQRLRNEVDRILSPADPAASPYAIARQTAGTGQEFRQGIQDAHNVFSNPKTHNPDLVADQLAQNPSAPYRTGFTAEARGDLANMMNDATSQFGPTGDRAARKGMFSTNAERKVRQLAASPQAADELFRVRNAETAFAQTRNAIEGNSVTAASQAAQKEFPNAAANSQGAGRIVDATWQGVALALARKAANAATNGHLNRQLARMAADAARVLSATGMQRDAYFQGLTRHIQSQGISAARAQQISRAVETMVLAERQNLISEPSRN